MSGTVAIKTYAIEFLPVQELDTGQWRVDLTISWESEGERSTRPFSVKQTHSTQEEAEIHGIMYGSEQYCRQDARVSLG